MSAPDKATLSSRTMATITAAARTIYPYDASIDDVYARAKEQLDEAAREDFAAPGTIEDAVVLFARGSDEISDDGGEPFPRTWWAPARSGERMRAAG
jgi:hypothetical protein